MVIQQIVETNTSHLTFACKVLIFSACFHWVDKKLPRVENRFSTRGNLFANVLDRAELFVLQR